MYASVILSHCSSYPGNRDGCSRKCPAEKLVVRSWSCCRQATFHYSSQLQTWLQTWFSTRFAARFSTSLCGFATCFRHAFDCCINLDMSRLILQVRWFVRVLDKWNAEKTCFLPANEPVEAGLSLRILLFMLIVT